MRAAIVVAEAGIKQGQSPFGAAIYDAKGEPIVAEHNQVKALQEPTAHAEVAAIRSACEKIGQADLKGFWLFSTCEPCAMCAGAIVLAGIHNVVFGASVEVAKQSGFSTLQFPCRELFDRVGSEFVVYENILAEECRQLFAMHSA